MIYVDSNVILDVFRADPAWCPWSEAKLAQGRAGAQLVTGFVVAAEIGHYMASAESLRSSLGLLEIALIETDTTAAWLAGQAYREYRRRGGERGSLLPDFLIGGHAMALDATLLTRDARRYRSYFPDLGLITPEESE